MARRDRTQSPRSETGVTLSRRRFLQGGFAAATTAALALAQDSSEAASANASARDTPHSLQKSKRPNILIIMCDQMRFPPSYESDLLKQFREAHLEFQSKLLAEGVSFQRHYIMSSACVPSRASMLTGHYPSLHGTSQTVGTAKEDFEPDQFWLDPNSVPTLGNYFREAGYLTFWVGKWHVSAANMMIPGTHEPLLSFDPDTGARDPKNEELYKAANRLDPFGFSGWIGPEPHGDYAVKDTGSSVPQGKRGRDISFAEQAAELIQELDQHPSSAPWLTVCSFVNPHDIGCWGMFTQPNAKFDANFQFTIDESLKPPVPAAGDLFTRSFTQSMNDDLRTKPKAQKSFRDNYHVWMNPILAGDQFMRFYYQVHKDADEEMMKVFNALQKSRYKDNTIVVFTSDHGELLLAHGGMKQKMYQAYDETTRVPLMIWYPAWFKGPRTIDALTSHADFLPTLLGLAGIEPEPIRQKLATNHSDALPLEGRDLSSVILGRASPAKVNDPVYYMTDDDPTRGLHMKRKIGVGYYPIVEPAHVETVIARLDDGHLWKYSRYFDNPQYWSEPGTPGDAKKPALDVLRVERQKDPAPEVYQQPETICCELTVKGKPVPDEFEMYDLDDDPTEVKNLYNIAKYSAKQSQLAKLLKEQRTLKRLSPVSGIVPGQT